MKKGLIVFSLLVFALCLTACKKDISGKYNLVQMTNGGSILTEFDLKSYGIHFEIDIESDGKASLIEGDKTTALTYDDNKFSGIDPSTNEKREFTYVVNDKEITLEEYGEKMIFRKQK